MDYDVNKDQMTQFKSREQVLAYNGSVVAFYPGAMDIDDVKKAIDKNGKAGRYEATANNGSISLKAE